MSENTINPNFNTKTENSIIVTCPHCNLLIFIFEKEYNCKIFRHGVYKNNISQIAAIFLGCTVFHPRA